MRRPRASLLVLFVALAVVRPGRADDLEAAKEAYDRGAAAFDRGAYAEAAVEFAHADELGPNPVALESALKAATLADDPVLAMTLVDRSEGRQDNERVATAVRKAREKFQTRAGKLLVRCRTGESCTLKIGGEPVAPGARRWVRAGDQSVEVTAAGRTDVYTVHVEGGASVEWQPRSLVSLPPSATPATTPSVPAPRTVPGAASAQQPSDVPPPHAGIAPGWFFAAAGATAVLAGVMVWSGVDTLDKHSAYMDGDDSAEAPGRSAQTRTNVLLGVTGAAAIGTAVLGVFAVDWGGHKPDAPRATAAIGPTGAAFSLTLPY